MNIPKLMYEYEKIKNMAKQPAPKWAKDINTLTFILGIGAICFTLFSYITYDIKCSLIILLFIFSSWWLYLSFIHHFMKEKIANAEKIITKNDLLRVKYLKRLLIREKICVDDTEKIQVIIEDIKEKKYQLSKDLKTFFVEPMGVMAIPVLLVVFDNIIVNKSTVDQVELAASILLILVIGSIIVYGLVEGVRYMRYQKYDTLINDLKILQIIQPKDIS
ncbi:hypothetical protein ACLGL1_01775 [Peptococcus simiae]|uniref:hypothetical protein n=1 Tax=Peptococcus simiae TaxID=1643805 RepID=UPI003980F877